MSQLITVCRRIIASNAHDTILRAMEERLTGRRRFSGRMDEVNIAKRCLYLRLSAWSDPFHSSVCCELQKHFNTLLGFDLDAHDRIYRGIRHTCQHIQFVLLNSSLNFLPPTSVVIGTQQPLHNRLHSWRKT